MYSHKKYKDGERSDKVNKLRCFFCIVNPWSNVAILRSWTIFCFTL